MSAVSTKPGDESHDPLVGKRFVEYEFVSRLGKGAFGIVYLARHPRLNTHVAVKYLELQDPGAARAVDKEVELLARLRHPYIVSVSDRFAQDNYSLIVLQYISGGNLRQKLEKMPNRQFDVGMTLALLDQISSALDYIHHAHILHLDLKPENILIEPMPNSPTPNFYLTDFGVSRLANKAEISVVGTPRYMAPEQFEPRSIDQSADIYALGVLLYELLAGIPPFRAASQTEMAYQHRQVRPRPLSELVTTVPPSVDAVILRALEKNPAARFPSAGELNRALKQAAAATQVNPSGLAMVNQLAGQYATQMNALVSRSDSRLSLAITTPDGASMFFPCDRFPISVGRGLDNDLILEHDLISRHHFSLQKDANGRVLVVDQGARNPVYVDGQPVLPGSSRVWSPEQYLIVCGFLLAQSLQERATPQEINTGQFVGLLNQIQERHRPAQVTLNVSPQVIAVRIGQPRYLVAQVRAENTPPARYRLQVFDAPGGVTSTWLTLPAERELQGGDSISLELLVTAPAVPAGDYELYLGLVADQPGIPEVVQIIRVKVEAQLVFDAALKPNPIAQRRFVRCRPVLTLINRGNDQAEFVVDASADEKMRVSPAHRLCTLAANTTQNAELHLPLTLSPRWGARRKGQLGYTLTVRGQVRGGPGEVRVLHGIYEFPARRRQRSLISWGLTVLALLLVVFVAYRLMTGSSMNEIASELFAHLAELRAWIERLVEGITG